MAPKEHHRLSFSLHLGRSHTPVPPPPISISWEVETPPVLLHGRPEDSAGALLAGQLKVEVKADCVEVTACQAALKVRVQQKRPYQGHCKDCETQVTELQNFSWLQSPVVSMKKGTHCFPFSALIAGHLPATMESVLGSISYEFSATVTTAKGDSVTFNKPVLVRRTIQEIDHDHHSVRVFPPTNIAAHVYYPSIIHPGKENTLRFHLDGLSRVNNSETLKRPQVEYWKVRKISWRLDETVRMVAPACNKHTPTARGATRKGILRSETRSIGSADLIEGWKAVYSPHDAMMEMEMKYIAQVPRRSGQGRPICDLRANDGTEVAHSLIIEMVVVQEVAPISQPDHHSPTGTARILRMHFNTTLTEEASAQEVSWEEEAPPLYENVPPSPPGYPKDEGAPAYAQAGSSMEQALNSFRCSNAARTGDEELPDAFETSSATDSSTSGILEGHDREGRLMSF